MSDQGDTQPVRDNKEYMDKVYQNFLKRLSKCIEAEGGAFEI